MRWKRSAESCTPIDTGLPLSFSYRMNFCFMNGTLWTVYRTRGNTLGQGHPIVLVSLEILSLKILSSSLAWWLTMIGDRDSDNSKKFAIILLKLLWLTQRSEWLNTRDHRGYTPRENTFSKSFISHCEGISLVAWEGSNPSQKHIYNNKDILINFFILIMGFSRQKYWSGLPFAPQVDHLLSELFTITILS